MNPVAAKRRLDKLKKSREEYRKHNSNRRVFIPDKIKKIKLDGKGNFGVLQEYKEKIDPLHDTAFSPLMVS